MYLVEFFKRLLKLKNWGVIIYLIFNVLFVVILFSGFFAGSPLGIFYGLLMYIASVSIALSPVGEWMLRKQTGCDPIRRVEDKERLFPLFEEVYQKAKEKDETLSPNIQLYINDEEAPNAFATGRNTICLTKGLLTYSDKDIKAILAHEFAHLSHKDTDYILLVTVGNLIVNVFFILTRVIFRAIGIGVAIANRSFGTWLSVLLIDSVYLGLWNFWTWIGTMLVLHSGRAQEFEADKFAYELGYGNELAYSLDELEKYSGEAPKGLFARLVSTHPKTDLRIAKLQELGATYRRK